MKAETVYQKLLEKTSKNVTNGSNSLDRGRAVYLFNEEQNKFVEWSLQKRNNFDVEDVQILLDSTFLKVKETTNEYTTFSLPSDYFSFANISIKASNSQCKDIPLLPVQLKPENTEEVLFDEGWKPSIKYRETMYTIQGNSVKVYTDGFDISKLKLSYYKYPIQLDLEGYITEMNTSSVNVDPEFDDKIVDRIISMCTTSFDINNENLNKVQFDINRVNSKF